MLKGPCGTCTTIRRLLTCCGTSSCSPWCSPAPLPFPTPNMHGARHSCGRISQITGIALNVDSSFELLEQNESIRSAIAERTFASVNGGGLMTFRDIGTVSDFWLWCRGPFLGMIASNTFPDTPGFFGRYYNTRPTLSRHPPSDPSVSHWDSA